MNDSQRQGLAINAKDWRWELKGRSEHVNNTNSSHVNDVYLPPSGHNSSNLD